MSEKIRYYSSYSDDFVTSKNQNCKISDEYKWIRHGVWARALSAVIYGIAVAVGAVYSTLRLHLGYNDRKKMQGAIIYGNHTQPIGDIFIPALASLPTRIYVVVSPANYGIPVVRKILPYLGALPLSDTIQGTKKLMDAICRHLSEGRNVVIYPEAHVWEYYTGIRPFSESSFKLAVKFKAPVYCTTTTYQRRKFGKRPKTTVYIDGPFYSDDTLSPKEAAVKLRTAVYSCMKERSKNSTYEYIKYKNKA